MLEKTGIPTDENLQSVLPSEQRLDQGPVAIIECYQSIPCNPCYTACNRGAITEFEDINDLPKIDFELCNGCALCVSKCPGLAIMIMDKAYSQNETMLKLPYEFVPLPSEGSEIDGVDREGNFVTKVKVLKVLNPKSFDKTPIVHITLPHEYALKVRNIKVEV